MPEISRLNARPYARASWLASAGLATVALLAPVFSSGAAPLPDPANVNSPDMRVVQAAGSKEKPPDNTNEPMPQTRPGVSLSLAARVETGTLDMMDISQSLAAPLDEWLGLLPAIIESGQYAHIPFQIKLQIPLQYYYFDSPGGNGKIIKRLIDTQQFGFATEEVQKSVMPEILIEPSGNGYMSLVSIFKDRLWMNLSEKTRAELEANGDIWVAEVSLEPDSVDMTGTETAQGRLPILGVAADYNEAKNLSSSVFDNAAKHPGWDKVKRAYIRSAAQARQLKFVTETMWATYSLDDAKERDDRNENLYDLSAQAGQWHLLPDRLVVEGGINALRAEPDPINTGTPESVIKAKQARTSPLYHVVMSSETMKDISSTKLDVLRQATKYDLTKEYDTETGYTPLFWILYHNRADAIADSVWEEFTRNDVIKTLKDGLRLADWIANAGEEKRIIRHLRDEEVKALPAKGSLVPVQITWEELSQIKKNLAGGKIDKETMLLKRDSFDHTRAYRLFRSGMLTAEEAGQILTILNLEDLAAPSKKDGDSALMVAAHAGFLRKGIAPEKLWNEIRANPSILTKKFKNNDFVLNAWTKNPHFPALADVPADIVGALGRDAWFQEDGIGAHPAFWSYVVGFEDYLPWHKNIFTVYDLFIEVPSRGNALLYALHNDEKYQKMRQFKKNLPERGPMAKMLARFPFPEWQKMRADSNDTGLLILGRTGLTEHMPQGFRDRITADDLSHVGSYNDTLVMWYSINYYKPARSSALSQTELVRKEEMAKVAPGIWAKSVRAPAATDKVPESIREILEKGGFPVLELTKAGFSPPQDFTWTSEMYEKQDATGNGVLKEMDRHGDMIKNPEILHRLAKFGLLDKNRIPAYIMAHYQNADDWTFVPMGEKMDAFDYAVENGQIAASSWGPEGNEWLVRRGLPAEKWISPTPSGKIPVIKMIRDGIGDQIPLSILENKDIWTPENFRRVFSHDNWKGHEGRMVAWWTLLEQYLDDSRMRDYKPWVENEMKQLGISPALRIPQAKPAALSMP